MLIGGIVAAAVVVAALTVALLTRRIAHDDVHSVEGYHRSIHTLETINAHPASTVVSSAPVTGANAARAESALRLVGTPSVRVTDAPTPSPTPTDSPASAESGVAPLAVTHPDAPVKFDDTGPAPTPAPREPLVARDKAMGSINHRPRRLAAPAAAVAVVVVLVVVLLLTGSHKVVPPARHHHGSSGKNTRSHVGNAGRTTSATTTSTTSPPVVVPQSGGTSRSATYGVTGGTFTLAFSATSGACWVDASNSSSGAPLFVGTLEPGQQHSLTSSGPVSVVIGAPTVLAVSVNGSPVALPSGFQTPFTMKFVTAT
jgi:hypothetical protein